MYVDVLKAPALRLQEENLGIQQLLNASKSLKKMAGNHSFGLQSSSFVREYSRREKTRSTRVLIKQLQSHNSQGLCNSSSS